MNVPEPRLRCITKNMQRHCVWVVRTPQNASPALREAIFARLHELSQSNKKHKQYVKNIGGKKLEQQSLL